MVSGQNVLVILGLTDISFVVKLNMLLNKQSRRHGPCKALIADSTAHEGKNYLSHPDGLKKYI